VALKAIGDASTRKTTMFQTILQALVPVVSVAELGWLVGRLGVLDPQRSITTFIATVALPAALFVGVFSFSPSQLENGIYLLFGGILKYIICKLP
jgi:predicted permease